MPRTQLTFSQTSHHHARPATPAMHWRVTRTAFASAPATPIRAPGTANVHVVLPAIAPAAARKTMLQTRLSLRHVVDRKTRSVTAVLPTPMLGRPGAARGTPAPPPAAAMWQRQTPDLVWRKREDAASSDAPARHSLQADRSGASKPGPAKNTPSVPLAAMPSAAAIAAQLRASPVDAVLADRLALEVIRRVERSMRIERERRGL